MPASDMLQGVPVLNMPLGVSVLDATWGGSCDGSGDVDGGEWRRVAASSSSLATFGGHRPRSSASRTELGSSSSGDIRNPEGWSEDDDDDSSGSGTLQRNLLEDSDEDAQPSDEGSEELGEGQENPYLKEYLRVGRAGAIKMIWEREWDFHQGVIRGMPEDGWHIKTMQVLLLTEHKLLEAILEGSLQKAKKSDRDLENLLHQLRSKGDEQPCHLCSSLSMATGSHPRLARSSIL